jgi:hypothetical protein
LRWRGRRWCSARVCERERAKTRKEELKKSIILYDELVVVVVVVLLKIYSHIFSHRHGKSHITITCFGPLD